MFGSDGRRFVWRMDGKALQDKNIKKTVKYGGGSIMIWGCMSGAGVGKVHIIDGILDSKGYINLLKQNVHTSAEKLGIRSNFMFYQDNDPKHTSWNAKNWLLYNCPKVLATPAQSPDMNPIEHLWGELKKRLASRCVSSKSQLKQAVLEEWEKIEPTYCKKLVESMPRRLQEVIKYKGRSTKY